MPAPPRQRKKKQENVVPVTAHIRHKDDPPYGHFKEYPAETEQLYSEYKKTLRHKGFGNLLAHGSNHCIE